MTTTKKPEEMTLSEHAEAWHKENGRKMPPTRSKKWDRIYREWIKFAFADIGKSKNKL